MDLAFGAISKKSSSYMRPYRFFSYAIFQEFYICVAYISVCGPSHRVNFCEGQRFCQKHFLQASGRWRRSSRLRRHQVAGDQLGSLSYHCKHLQIQQEIEEKKSSNSKKSKLTTFWKVGLAKWILSDGEIDCRVRGWLPASGRTMEHKIRTFKSLLHWGTLLQKLSWGEAHKETVWPQVPRGHRRIGAEWRRGHRY